MPETKMLADFLDVYEGNDEVKVYLQIEWYDDADKAELAVYKSQPVSRESLLDLRKWVCYCFACRLQSICTEAMWNRVNRDYRQAIEQFDALAAKWGFMIGEPRLPISVTEALADAGLINVDRKGIVTINQPP